MQGEDKTCRDLRVPEIICGCSILCPARTSRVPIRTDGAIFGSFNCWGAPDWRKSKEGVGSTGEKERESWQSGGRVDLELLIYPPGLGRLEHAT